MLGHWLRNAKRPTWKAVVDALCLMGEHKVALKIQTKYCTDTGKVTYSVVVLLFFFILLNLFSMISLLCPDIRDSK